jgi:transcriptional regulator with XRE-family HTH domain
MEMSTMNFGEQIKQIRLENNLTQDQMASKLNVTRQAVSNWENDRNLPDIEMLITISSVFHLPLDQLILGGGNMNNMKDKLIRDGSETRRAKFNLVSIAIGAALLLVGLSLIAIKAASVEYIDEAGILHENFFLLPIAFLFLFSGFLTFFITGIRHLIMRLRKNK